MSTCSSRLSSYVTSSVKSSRTRHGRQGLLIEHWAHFTSCVYTVAPPLGGDLEDNQWACSSSCPITRHIGDTNKSLSEWVSFLPLLTEPYCLPKLTVSRNQRAVCPKTSSRSDGMCSLGAFILVLLLSGTPVPTSPHSHPITTLYLASGHSFRFHRRYRESYYRIIPQKVLDLDGFPEFHQTFKHQIVLMFYKLCHRIGKEQKVLIRFTPSV